MCLQKPSVSDISVLDGADPIVKPNICIDALAKVAFCHVFTAICLFLFECRKEGFGRCVVIRTNRIHNTRPAAVSILGHAAA